MFNEWFDGRFHAAGARSHRLSLARLCAAAGLWSLIGLSVSWQTAGIWALAAVATEWPVRAVTRPMRRGETLSAAESWICVVAWFALVSVWSAAGAILWASANPACQLAGAAVFAAQIFYVEAHHGRSLGALIPALPALAAPVVAPLAAAHYRGPNQILVVATFSALALHGAVSLWLSHREGRRLLAAEAEAGRLGEELAAASRRMIAFTAQALRQGAGAEAASSERAAVRRARAA